MRLVTTKDGVEYEFVPSADLHKVKEIVVYIKNLEKYKRCSKNCDAIKTLKRIMEGV